MTTFQFIMMWIGNVGSIVFFVVGFGILFWALIKSGMR